ncbi:MAG: helix-turn-helix domain-containing protein [Treponema sp.]|nr:helix-turn-helix domain-containing protein [Treponema sp.]
MKKEITLESIKDKPMLSRNETAFYLGLHVNSLDRANIPHCKIGRRCIYSKQVLDKWLADNSTGGTK